MAIKTFSNIALQSPLNITTLQFVSCMRMHKLHQMILILNQLDFLLVTIFCFHLSFFGPKGPPKFFTQQISGFYKDLIRQGSALLFIGDFFIMSNYKSHMPQLIKQLQNMNLSPERSFFVILTVNYLVHEVGFITNKLIIAEHV